MQSDFVHDPARHVDAAAIRIELGLAASKLGGVSRARAEASRAEAIYATHSVVSARAAERLRELRKQLDAVSAA
jgi:hypothetical protein